MEAVDIVKKMRAEWDQRAREDAYYYAVFARRGQSEEEFLATAADTVPVLEKELSRLTSKERALEIGCGPGRLMRPMSVHFKEIHGVDISPEMIALAQEALKDIPNAKLHLTPQSDLSMFPADHFDYIYSYTVFQHIPSREVVLNYIRESQRTLKPGGILCCQLRGTPPLEAELERESETWTGSTFKAEELLALSNETGFHLVSIEGAETQYQWTTWLKPSEVEQALSPAMVKSVTDRRVPQKGPKASVSLWLEGLPKSRHLGNLQVAFGAVHQTGCYLSPIDETGACQLNAMLPKDTPLSPINVSLIGVPGEHEIEVIPTAIEPNLVAITDAINLASKNKIETGGLKVTLEGIEFPTAVSFHIEGIPAHIIHTELKDPIRLKYEYSFYLPDKELEGKTEVKIRVLDRDLDPVPITIIKPPPYPSPESVAPDSPVPQGSNEPPA